MWAYAFVAAVEKALVESPSENAPAAASSPTPVLTDKAAVSPNATPQPALCAPCAALAEPQSHVADYTCNVCGPVCAAELSAHTFDSTRKEHRVTPLNASTVTTF